MYNYNIILNVILKEMDSTTNLAHDGDTRASATIEDGKRVKQVVILALFALLIPAIYLGAKLSKHSGKSCMWFVNTETRNRLVKPISSGVSCYICL